jgi:hypothetical protein
MTVVRSEGRHLHVANVAALPLVRLVLQILDEIVLRLTGSPTVPCRESISQMLLCPRDIVLHLRISGVLLQSQAPRGLSARSRFAVFRRDGRCRVQDRATVLKSPAVSRRSVLAASDHLLHDGLHVSIFPTAVLCKYDDL